MITIEMIDEFRRRTNCSYDDAKYYLEKYNGDMLEAIIAFERAGNRNHGHHYGKHGFENRRPRADFGQRILRVLQRLLDIRIVIADRTGKTFNIPILFPIILVPAWHIIVLIAIGMMLMGYRFNIREVQDENYNLDNIVSRIRERTQARSK
jgi:hypothetical protein